MQTLRDIAPYVALASAVVSLVLLVFVLVLWSGIRKLRRAQTVVLGRHEQRDIVGLIESLDSQVRNLREAVEILTDELDEQKRRLGRALTNRSIIRYDAFRDAGGEQSASFALLDDYRSGVVFSAIAARDFARIYVKHLTEGVADRDLSPEEAQAVAAAVPRPLGRDDQGPRAARAPMPADAEAERARAAFDELGAAVTTAPVERADRALPEQAGAVPAPDDTADFTWQPGRERPADGEDPAGR